MRHRSLEGDGLVCAMEGGEERKPGGRALAPTMPPLTPLLFFFFFFAQAQGIPTTKSQPNFDASEYSAALEAITATTPVRA